MILDETRFMFLTENELLRIEITCDISSGGKQHGGKLVYLLKLQYV